MPCEEDPGIADLRLPVFSGWCGKMDVFSLQSTSVGVFNRSAGAYFGQSKCPVLGLNQKRPGSCKSVAEVCSPVEAMRGSYLAVSRVGRTFLRRGENAERQENARRFS
jgi:hypothetical protein